MLALVLAVRSHRHALRVQSAGLGSLLAIASAYLLGVGYVILLIRALLQLAG
jgi:hypothetical protein